MAGFIIRAFERRGGSACANQAMLTRAILRTLIQILPLPDLSEQIANDIETPLASPPSSSPSSLWMTHRWTMEVDYRADRAHNPIDTRWDETRLPSCSQARSNF